MDLSYPDSKMRRGRSIELGEISPTLTCNYQNNIIQEGKEMESEYAIRKLTPRECWRLMSFSDEDYEKAEKVNSNTQLYKQAGNSIVKDVIYYILKQMV